MKIIVSNLEKITNIKQWYNEGFSPEETEEIPTKPMRTIPRLKARYKLPPLKFPNPTRKPPSQVN